MSAGLFITLEGGEGAGKSTQLKKLAASLRSAGHACVETREPGGTPEAEALREVFITHKGNNWPPAAQVLLMNAARALHTENLIKPALADGKIVLCDRYSDSTRVYQGSAGGYDVNKIDTITAATIGDFAPDLTFIFDIDPRVGLSRTKGRGGKGDTFEDKDIDFHDKLRGGFLEIAKDNPDRCVIIDASQDMQLIADQLLAEVLKRL